ncbi:hypothetical protein [Kitasatospora sp. NPDC005751]|uniref:hypothetical protein n=1 Tax=Kitasatospora sp. NPDC005751 TaxID=3157064 RepID=UPI0033C15588
MDIIDFTHVVTRAGSAFGFTTMAVTGMTVYYSHGRTLHAVKQRSVWVPWAASAGTMILASSVSGGVVGKVGAGFTGTGDKAGAAVGSVALGQSGAASVDLTATEVLSYSGSWLALTGVIGLGLYVYFAKSWKERALALSGAVTGATWGLASSIGGWAAMVGVPLVSWLGDTVIG